MSSLLKDWPERRKAIMEAMKARRIIGAPGFVLPAKVAHVAGIGQTTSDVAFASVSSFEKPKSVTVVTETGAPPDPYTVKPAGRQIFARDGKLLRGFLSRDEKCNVVTSVEKYVHDYFMPPHESNMEGFWKKKV